MTIEFRAETGALERVDLSKRYRATVGQIINRSINAALRKGRTLATDAVGEELNLPKNRIRNKFSLRPAVGAEGEASLSAKKRGTLLSSFPYRQLFKRKRKVKRTAGISVKQFKKRGADVFPRAFLIRLSNQGRNEAGEENQRFGIAQRLPGEGRKYEVLKAPSVSQSFNKNKERISNQMREFQRAEFLRQARLVLQK